jgi:hypothetical protein
MTDALPQSHGYDGTLKDRFRKQCAAGLSMFLSNGLRELAHV